VKVHLPFGVANMSTSTSSSHDPLSRNWWYETSRQCFAEFVGDFFFVFIGSMATGGIVGAAFAHGLTIALLVISLGPISGGHFNPAVTLGVTISNAIHPLRAIFFVIFQLLGGFIGSLFVRITSPDYEHRNGITTIGRNLQGEDVANAGQAIVLEILLTYLLVQTVLCAAVDSDGKNTLAPLAIGFTLAVDIFAGGDITGASMNPARSLGPSVVASIFGGTSRSPWEYHYVYWVGPIVGSIIAALFYRLVLAKREHRLLV